MARNTLRLACSAAIALTAALTLPAAHAAAGRVATSQAAVPAPALSIPPDGLHGHALWDSYYDLAPFGYEEQELFVSGTAVDNGKSAPYTTRMIVTRPTDPTRFNGTVNPARYAPLADRSVAYVL